MGDIVSGIGNAIGSAVDGLESVGSDALQVGGKLLSNPAVDTAIGSMFGCPELGMIAPIIGGLTNSAGSSSPSSLGQMPGMFGGSDPLGGLLNQGSSGIFGGGLGNILGELQGLLGGLNGIGGGMGGPISGFPPISGGFPPISGFPPTSGGTGSPTSGIPSAGGFDPNGGLGQLLGGLQGQQQFQQQLSAINLAFTAVSKEISMAEDLGKAAINNIH